ncbi:MAG: Gfo/Idh/MocA family oxidoreductase [Bryobacteraceae bacterium]|nr:Gfo/Idh/MocA family oxidoreductase [Bryobacterales bacterium]MEB2361397.1 Gfo/Idh/MocA family oxidoreductase [Bryobacterales bacterium]NUN03830.1 Gfo/Idh/MocA family oxidoreductase [Bryobacteraceae bacterium]
MKQNRRSFLQGAAVAAVAGSASRILGANDRVNVAVVGLGGRGRAHVTEWAKVPGSRIVALCDVDQAALERGQALAEKTTGEKTKGYVEMRKLFEDKDIDAVSMPLPNHWHALATIWACQAGKDVYIEKPACHNVWEGKKMVEAARKYNRMVQIGSQSRTVPIVIRAMQLLKEGVIGKVYLAKGLCYKRRPSIGHKPDGPVPPGVNWDLFLGPAPMRPFNENRFKYNWHWFWDTGNGDIGNQGVHEMDIARWGLGVAYPKSVVSFGGKYVYDDDQETPNTQYASFDYGGMQIDFEVRGIFTDGTQAMPRQGRNTVGDLFYGADGYMSVDGSGFQVYKGEKHEKVMDEKAERGVSSTMAHMDNFAKAIRSRNYKDLTADVELGVISADLCHLANIAYRVGRKLTFNAQAGQFVNDAAASKLLTRDYRKPYVVPDKV